MIMSALELVWSRIIPVTVWMAVAAVVVQVLLWITRPVAPRTHRLAWACVLLSGILFVQFPIPIAARRLERALPLPLQKVVLLNSEVWLSQPAATAQQSDPSQHRDPRLAAVPVQLAESPGAQLESRSADKTPLSSEPTTSRTPKAADSPLAAWTWGEMLAAFWVGGIGLVLGLNIFGYGRLVRHTRRMRPASDPYAREWDALLADRRIARRIPLLASSDCGPALCLTPGGYRLIVPESRWGSLSPAERLGILRHELAHFERNDLFKSLVARCVVVLHWFNPVAWWAQRKFDAAGEWACDDFAGGREGRVEFAKVLLELGTPPFASVPLADAAAGGSLHSRIRRLLSLSPLIDRP